jgi:hypothetical protein
MKKVYIVFREAGAHDDYRTDNLMAFYNRGSAKQFRSKYNAEAERIIAEIKKLEEEHDRLWTWEQEDTPEYEEWALGYWERYSAVLASHKYDEDISDIDGLNYKIQELEIK